MKPHQLNSVPCHNREGDKIDNTYSTAVAPWDWWKDIEGFWLNWYR